MKAVLVGTDYLQVGNDVKILETNTNTAIINTGVDMLEYASLFNLLVSNNITEFHYIFTEGHSSVPVGQYEFNSKLNDYCNDNNISFHEYEVPRNSITVPDIEDAPNKFILRQAYDSSAIFDSNYTADKFEFFSLMSGSSYIPKTYFSSSEDGMYLDTIDSVDFSRTDHPNLVEKERFPSYDSTSYPALSIIQNEGELNTKKSNVAETTRLLQEFVYDDSSTIDGYWSVIRSFDIIYGGELDIVNLGGYRHSATVSLTFAENEFQTGTRDLTNKSRLKYINKNLYKNTPIPYHTDLESDILMFDGTISTVSTLQEGDVIKTINLNDQYSISGSSILPWEDVSNLETISSSFEFVSSSLVSKESQSVDSLMVEITLDGGEKWNDTQNAIYYVEESGSSDTSFISVNHLLVGDKIVSVNKDTDTLSTKEITDLQIVYVDDLEIYNLDFEPKDYFMVDIGNSEFAIMHNVCTGCSWSSCGDYWCDNTCIGCGFGGGQK